MEKPKVCIDRVKAHGWMEATHVTFFNVSLGCGQWHTFYSNPDLILKVSVYTLLVYSVLISMCQSLNWATAKCESYPFDFCHHYDLLHQQERLLLLSTALEHYSPSACWQIIIFRLKKPFTVYRLSVTTPEVGKLRPEGHMWPNELLHRALRAAQSFLQKLNSEGRQLDWLEKEFRPPRNLAC